MSTYVIDYTELDGNAKRGRALADIVEYLGWEKFAEIHHNLLVEFKVRPALGAFKQWMSLAGIQGYPAQAWYEHLWGA